MEIVVSWTKNLCLENSEGVLSNHVDSDSAVTDKNDDILQKWSVLDIGTGNGLLLQEFAKQGYDSYSRNKCLDMRKLNIYICVTDLVNCPNEKNAFSWYHSI